MCQNWNINIRHMTRQGSAPVKIYICTSAFALCVWSKSVSRQELSWTHFPFYIQKTKRTQNKGETTDRSITHAQVLLISYINIQIKLYIEKLDQKKVVPMLNKLLIHEDVWLTGRVAPHILNLSVVSFTPRPLHPRRKASGIHWMAGLSRTSRELFEAAEKRP